MFCHMMFNKTVFTLHFIRIIEQMHKIILKLIDTFVLLFLHLTYTFIRLSYKKLICTLLTRREYLNMIPGVPKKLDIVNKNDISM